MGLFGSRLDGDQFQSESFRNGKLADSHPKAWLVRPCEWYKDEYKECSSFRGKVHQYFIFGKTLDCSQWKEDYNNCLIVRKNPSNIDALTKVIESEEKRIAIRLTGSERNDVWTYRAKPPENWNAPVPQHLKSKGFNYLEMKAAEKKRREEENPEREKQPV